MYKTRAIIFCLCFLITTASAMASEDKFESKELLDELEKKLELSQEKIEKLKPVLDKKSADLKQTIHDAVDKGFVQLDETTKKLNEISKDTEKKVQDFLTGEEMQLLKDYLNKVDKDAIQESKDQLVVKLTELLDLTEEQITKLEPVLEDTVEQLEEMLTKLTTDGTASLEEFKKQYQSLMEEMSNKLQNELDDEQAKKLEEYNKSRKDNIQQAIFT